MVLLDAGKATGAAPGFKHIGGLGIVIGVKIAPDQAIGIFATLASQCWLGGDPEGAVREHEAVANKRNVPFVAEFYVDLGYRADGSLIIARRPRATPVEDAQQRARKALTEGLATADTGEDFPMRVDSICVHSDTPNAVEVARAVRGVIDSVRG